MVKRTRLLLSLVAAVAVAAQAPQVPDALRPPEGQSLAFQAHGVGVQIYACGSGGSGAYGWVFKAPEAKLADRDGKEAGKHFAGPTWQANDGSSVTGKPAASVPSPDAGSVPWLLLQASKSQGAGVLSGVLSIQRLNTKGGKAPSSGCDAARAKAELRVPYEADYYFYSGSKAR